jgi:NOL1/NOP2/fmu family ribosome biogenesis protein
MVQSLKILNSKETKQIYELLEAQYGYTGKLDAVFMLSEKKQRIYLFTRDLAKMDISRLRVDSMGLYFGTLFEGKLRLTIDGSQLIGPGCAKNVLEVSKKEMQTWLMGEKLLLSQLEHQPEEQPTDYVILRYNGHYLGCGKIGGDLILNYIPKTRYIHALYDDVTGAQPPVRSSELDE